MLPYAIVGPDGNVLLIEYANQTKTPATYRTKDSAQQALGYAKQHIPGAVIWDRRHRQ